MATTKRKPKKKSTPRKAKRAAKRPAKRAARPQAPAGFLRVQLKAAKAQCVAHVRVGRVVEQLSDGRILEANFTAPEHRQLLTQWGHLVDVERLGPKRKDA